MRMSRRILSAGMIREAGIADMGTVLDEDASPVDSSVDIVQVRRSCKRKVCKANVWAEYSSAAVLSVKEQVVCKEQV